MEEGSWEKKEAEQLADRQTRNERRALKQNTITTFSQKFVYRFQKP
jgi:hypothetical protein